VAPFKNLTGPAVLSLFLLAGTHELAQAKGPIDCTKLLRRAHQMVTREGVGLPAPRPVYPRRVAGIKGLREIIEARGITIVYEGDDVEFEGRPISQSYLAGGIPIIFTGDLSGPSEDKVKGLVLHIGRARVTSRILGEANPLLGYGELPYALEDKREEARFIMGIDPNAYAKTVFVSDLVKSPEFADQSAPELEQIRKKFVARKYEVRLDPADRELLLKFVGSRLDHFSRLFPDGAVLKHAHELMSGDSKTGIVKVGQVTSEELVDHFIKALAKLSVDLRTERIPFGSPYFLKRFSKNEVLRWDPYFTAVYALLFSPEELILQELLDIQEELRADFVNGSAVNVQPRYSERTLSDLEDRAAQFLNRFFLKADPRARHLSGGADVVLLKNGQIKIIELNLTGESAYIDPFYLPGSFNFYVSQITGNNTQLLTDIYEKANQGDDVVFTWLRNFRRLHLSHLVAKDQRDATGDILEIIRLERLKNLAREKGHISAADERKIDRSISALERALH
jgi:hypothetical protein